MPEYSTDLWGVWANPGRVRRNGLDERFADWRNALLQPLADEVAADADPLALARLAEEAAFAYVLTEENARRLRAVQALDRVAADDSPWLHAGHAEMYPQDRADLAVAETTKACVNAASWLWPVLDEDQRRRFVALVADRGGRVIYEDAEKGCWWGDALNSNWTAVLNSALGFAGLLRRQYDEAEGQAWVDRARGTIARMLDLAADEGAGIEGPGYWLYCFGSAQDLVETLANANAGNLYDHPFWGQCSRFLPYMALPDWSGWVPYADTGRRGLSGSAFFHGVASRARDPLAQWLGNEILRRHGGAGWRNVVYYDPTVAEEPVGTLPACRFFSSVQLASFRSGWEPDAVQLVFKGGSNAWSHTHLDLNSFFIARGGERLATDPGPWPYSVHLWHSVEPAVSTSWHNCIVVDGANQRMAPQYAMSYDLEEAGDCYSWLSDHLSSEHLEMIRGDATSAYADTLERAWRDVVYLKPDLFVIFDDLRARPARVQRNLEWMLHSEHPIRDVDGGLEVMGEAARLLVWPVFPRGREWKHVEGKAIPRTDQPLHCVSIRPYWHHKWNVDPSRSPYPHWDARGDAEPLYSDDCQFLVVLQVTAAELRAPIEVEGFEDGAAKGVHLAGQGEEWVVLFNPGRETLEVRGLRTDAEKLVVHRRGDDLVWGAVRCTTLVWNGETLMAAAQPTSVVGP